MGVDLFFGNRRGTTSASPLSRLECYCHGGNVFSGIQRIKRIQRWMRTSTLTPVIHRYPADRAARMKTDFLIFFLPPQRR